MRYSGLHARLYPLSRRDVAPTLAGIVRRAEARGEGTDWRLIANAQRFVDTQSAAEGARADAGLRLALRRAMQLRRLRRSVAARCIQRATLAFVWHPRRAMHARLAARVDALFSPPPPS